MPLIGATSPRVLLYLPNHPVTTQDFNPLSPNIPQLIEDNGNHWRKILTILAKLSCHQSDWKRYRDEQLLQRDECICFDDTLCFNNELSLGTGLAQSPDEQWHLVAGKASWQRLGLDVTEFTALDEQCKVFYRDRIILIPYPDYRQMPNALIEVVVGLMGR